MFPPPEAVQMTVIHITYGLRIITKLPGVTSTATLHEQTAMSLINNNIKGLANKMYLKLFKTGNSQIQN
jgi:hypothetical protein